MGSKNIVGIVTFGLLLVACPDPSGAPPDAGAMECEPGEAGLDCLPCEVGTYCGGGRGAVATACGDGDWDHDLDPATACIPWTVCSGDEVERSPGSATTDGECGCPPDTYLAGDTCLSYTDCAPGQFVATNGTATADRVCEACATGAFSDSDNANACVTWTDCALGESVLSDGSATADRTCEACDGESFSTEINATTCTAKTTCLDDEFVSNPGSAVADRACQACPDETTSTGPNAARCDDACTVVIGVMCTEVVQGYLKASNPDLNDGFGAAVAVSGDTLVVGAPREDGAARMINGDDQDNSGNFNGAAYVFVRTATTWSQQAYLKADDGEALESGQQFGSAVAIDGDTIVVGSPLADATTMGGTEFGDAGNVYVFTRSGTTWSQQARLTSSNFYLSDNFGASVAISGDTLAASAPGERSTATGINGDQTNDSSSPFLRSGAVYTFTRSGTTWTQEAYVKASNTGTQDRFGIAVDLDADTLVVGAPFEDSSAGGIDGNEALDDAADAGAVYVFTRAGAVWSQQAYVKSLNPMTNDQFGLAVSVDGDTLAVGAPNVDSQVGAAFIFTRTTGVWTQQALLQRSTTTDADHFGEQVSVSGDRVVVTADLEDGGSTAIGGDPSDNSRASSGAAYLFGRSGVMWTELAYIKATNPDFNDSFGGGPDYFGTGASLDGNTLVVGAHREDSASAGVDGDALDNSSLQSGAAYVYLVGP